MYFSNVVYLIHILKYAKKNYCIATCLKLHEISFYNLFTYCILNDNRVYIDVSYSAELVECALGESSPLCLVLYK